MDILERLSEWWDYDTGRTMEMCQAEIAQLQAEAYKANRRAELADGWRDHDKERADKAEKEVERLRSVVRKRTEEADDADYRAYTAWNDAIEAAAVTHEESGCCHASMYAASIRALKRSQP